MNSRNESLELYRLRPWEEAPGTLNSLKADEEVLIAQVGKILLALPLEMEEKMHHLVGLKISLLRTDEPQRPYLLRVVSDQNMKRKDGA
jgi:hypothetical protein